MNDIPLEIRRRRLRFRAARRGLREADAIFGTFAELHLDALDEAGLDCFEALLDVPDQDVYDWLRGWAPVPTLHDTPLFARFKAICDRKNPVWNV
ncbi:MAG TPA: succinate dehydrogenase assembly factor 2 [Rhizomicrobium sp.]|jgi:antitoxin CptB|nr:succinate dehydrogenase assembly factor 2 [Rhizomicrobium sp.]